jgi:hypothetical protein
VAVLEQELKRIKIFVFKIYLEGEGEYLTNAIDQELKSFLSNSYDIQDSMRSAKMNLAGH